MIDEKVDDFLEHHGVKGQKWGFRNKKSKIFAPTTKEERKIIRRSISARKGREVLKNVAIVGGSAAAGSVAGFKLTKIILEKSGATDLQKIYGPRIGGQVGALVTSEIASQILKRKGKTKVENK